MDILSLPRDIIALIFSNIDEDETTQAAIVQICKRMRELWKEYETSDIYINNHKLKLAKFIAKREQREVYNTDYKNANMYIDIVAADLYGYQTAGPNIIENNEGRRVIIDCRSLNVNHISVIFKQLIAEGEKSIILQISKNTSSVLIYTEDKNGNIPVTLEIPDGSKLMNLETYTRVIINKTPRFLKDVNMIMPPLAESVQCHILDHIEIAGFKDICGNTHNYSIGGEHFCGCLPFNSEKIVLGINPSRKLKLQSECIYLNNPANGVREITIYYNALISDEFDFNIFKLITNSGNLLFPYLRQLRFYFVNIPKAAIEYICKIADQLEGFYTGNRRLFISHSCEITEDLFCTDIFAALDKPKYRDIHIIVETSNSPFETKIEQKCGGIVGKIKLYLYSKLTPQILKSAFHKFMTRYGERLESFSVLMEIPRNEDPQIFKDVKKEGNAAVFTFRRHYAEDIFVSIISAIFEINDKLSKKCRLSVEDILKKLIENEYIN